MSAVREWYVELTDFLHCDQIHLGVGNFSLVLILTVHTRLESQDIRCIMLPVYNVH